MHTPPVDPRGPDPRRVELGMVLVAFLAIAVLLPLFAVALRSLGSFGLGVLAAIVTPLGFGWLWLWRRGSLG